MPEPDAIVLVVKSDQTSARTRTPLLVVWLNHSTRRILNLSTGTKATGVWDARTQLPRSRVIGNRPTTRGSIHLSALPRAAILRA